MKILAKNCREVKKNWKNFGKQFNFYKFHHSYPIKKHPLSIGHTKGSKIVIYKLPC